MLRDITIGKYYQTESIIHKLDPRTKIVAVFVYIISLFIFFDIIGYGVATIFLLSTILISKVPFTYIIKGLKPVLILLIFTAVFNLFTTKGEVIFQYNIITITDLGVKNAIFFVVRLIYLILGTSMLTYTTSPNQLTNGLESLLAPLKFLKIPVGDFAMMMTLSLRFIPILLEETNRIIDAQSARGVDFVEGNIFKRLKNMIAIVVPLMVSAIRRANDLSLAMESRCFRPGEKRSKFHPLSYKGKDIVVFIILIIYLSLIIIRF